MTVVYAYFFLLPPSSFFAFSIVFFIFYIFFIDYFHFVTFLHYVCTQVRFFFGKIVQEVVRWPSGTVPAFWAIPVLGRRPNADCTVVDVACLYRAASVPSLIIHISNAEGRTKMRSICLSLCHVSIGSCYLKLVHRLSSNVVHLVTYISHNTSIIWCMTLTLSFLGVIMRWGYLLAGITLKCLPSCRHIGRVITLRLRVGGESWRGLACFVIRPLRALHITRDTYLHILLVRNGLVHCNITVCGIHTHLNSRADLCWDQCASLWW